MDLMQFRKTSIFPPTKVTETCILHPPGHGGHMFDKDKTDLLAPSPFGEEQI